MADAALSPPAGTDSAGAESDETSYIRFVENTKTSLYAYAYSKTGSRDIAWDVLQDAYIEVFKRWPHLRQQHPDGQGLIRESYVYTIIRNKFMDYLRSELRRQGRDYKWHSQTLPLAEEVLPDSECIFGQTARELWAAVAELDPTQQSLIHLVYVDGKSTTQAAKEIGLAETTARRYHKNALSQLRTRISGEG